MSAGLIPMRRLEVLTDTQRHLALCWLNGYCPEALGKALEYIAPRADEEHWFDALCDAVDEYLNVMRQQQEAPKAERESFEARLHEAKREVIDRFYATGWAK